MRAGSRLRARSRAAAGQAALAAACVLSATCLVLGAGPAAQAGLDRAAVADAVRIGRSPDASRERFHAAYRVAVDDPVIRSVELVTGFRRIVQITEERVRLRDSTWDETRAANAAREFDGRLEVAVQLQFNPANTYRSVPAYSVVIYPRGTAQALQPVDVRSAPSYIASQPAPPGTPILAAIVTATFDAGRLDASAPFLAAVLLDGKEVRRVPVELGPVR